MTGNINPKQNQGSSPILTMDRAGHSESLLVNTALSSYNKTPMRRKLVSNLQFQMAFGLAMARGVIVGLLLPGLSAILALYLMSQHSDLLPEQKTILINGLNNLVVTFVWISLLLGLVNGVFGFLISQRFAGPLTRIETWSMQHLMKKNPGTLKIRDKDEFSGVAKALNRIVSKVNEEDPS